MIKSVDSAETGAGQKCTIDLDLAARLDIPFDEVPLRARGFTTTEGHKNWSVRIPGAMPIATPAYEDNMLFVGGGYGSYEFYGFHADSGDLVWNLQTADDGPTAAVAERGYVVFNTESCCVIVCESRTGRIVWQEWLGDPLMSQPAIAGDRLFVAYPARQHKPVLRPDMTIAQQRKAVAQAKRATRCGPYQHRMLCANLRTGEHLWEQEITGDAITAPVVDGDQLFLTCFDGTSFCLDVTDGSVIWKKNNAGTSAPLVVDGRVITTEKENADEGIFQRIRRSHRLSGRYMDRQQLFRSRSPFLSMRRGGGSSVRARVAAQMDKAVGFSSPPLSAGLKEASDHLGVSTVSGAWAYQGSRSGFAKGKIFSAQGTRVCCISDETQHVDWEAEVRGAQVDLDDQIFSPPAMGRDYLYLTSTLGHVLSVCQQTGEVGLLYDTRRPVAFQPCLAKGRVHFGTMDGRLISIDTGNGDADGWYMWGGNAQHNKVK